MHVHTDASIGSPLGINADFIYHGSKQSSVLYTWVHLTVYISTSSVCVFVYVFLCVVGGGG